MFHLLLLLWRTAIIIPVFLCSFSNTKLVSATIPTLPRSRNVDSSIFMFNDMLGDDYQLYDVKEFVDQARSSARVDVWDVSKVDITKAKKLSYYRLEKAKKTYELVKYDHALRGCSEENTSTWILSDFSRTVENLFAINEDLLKTDHIEEDSSLIGPNVMLQLIYDNADKFTLDSKGFDDINLANSYYFSSNVLDFGQDEEVKLIAIVQVNHINIDAHNDRDNIEQGINSKIKLGVTKLSELNMLGHVTGCALLTDLKLNSVSEYLAKKSALLVDFPTLRPPRQALLILFKLIQERSQSKQMGVSYDDQNSPHLLPAGVGCGEPASRHRPMYVFARQFSGHFSAYDHPNDYFAAYDQASNHFRHDSLGRHKIVYALNDRLATLIKVERGDGGGSSGTGVGLDRKSGGEQQATNNTAQDGPSSAKQPKTIASDQNRAHENSYHCAQSALIEDDSIQNQVLGADSIGDILGLGGPRIGLMYLGYDYLLNCHVYEREILHSQIPLLIRLHLRLKPSVSFKQTLVYYFVNELDSLTRNSPLGRQVHAYESMWLKQVELVSWSSLTMYTVLNARLTFSRFSWSLASVSEESHERQMELLHPVRMFDTLECWPARSQLQLDFVLKKRRSNKIRHHNKVGNTSLAKTKRPAHRNDRVTLVETLEESVIQFVMQRIDFPRSEICDFELIVPEDDGQQAEDEEDTVGDEMSGDDDDDARLPNSMLVRAKLIRPLDYVYDRYLVGWLQSIMPMLRFRISHQAQVVEHKYLMNIHECQLALAARFGGKTSQFYMLYCPRVGCATLTDDNKSLDEQGIDYIPTEKNNSKQQAPSGDSYPEMCEIYLVKRRFSTHALILDRFRPEKVRAKLEQSDMILEVYELTESSEFTTNLHTARVSGVSLTNGLDLNLIDDQFAKGICFTLNTKLVSQIDGKQLEMKLVELNFDKHHSRVHCHKACLMYEFCQSYSYSRTHRLCHLSSETRHQLLDQTLKLTLDNNDSQNNNKFSADDCTIHAINHVSLYKRRPIVIFNTLGRLLETKKLFIGSLDECANMCRLNELKRQKPSDAKFASDRPHEPAPGGSSRGCQHFSYIRMLALCVVENEVDELTGELTSVSALADLMNTTDDVTQVSELYQRDFLHEYAVKYATSVQLEAPQDDPGVTLMRGLDEFECSRECSILDRACVAFETCARSSSGGYEQVCRLYRIRSPFTVPRMTSMAVEQDTVVSEVNLLPESSLFRAQLTDLEAKFYVLGQSSEHKVSIDHKQGCSHYYLEADSLYLKRLLNVAKRNYNNEDESIESLANEMRAKSQAAAAVVSEVTDTTTSSSGPGEKTNKPDGDSSSAIRAVGSIESIAIIVLQALFGTLMGIAIFMMQPALVQLIANSELLETLRNGGLSYWRGPIGKRDRSMSRAEITEMIDLDEDEQQS